jgi:hypothetical protein
MKTVVITGSRDWADRNAIAVVLRGADRLVVGDCRSGADAIALGIAFAWDIIPTVLAASDERAEELRELACFVKQLGALYVPAKNGVGGRQTKPVAQYGQITRLRDSKGGDTSEWRADLRVREFPRPAEQDRAVGARPTTHPRGCHTAGGLTWT